MEKVNSGNKQPFSNKSTLLKRIFSKSIEIFAITKSEILAPFHIAIMFYKK